MSRDCRTLLVLTAICDRGCVVQRHPIEVIHREGYITNSQGRIMKKRTILVALLVLGSGMPAASAATGNASGAEALALAGVVASHSPALSHADRQAMAELFDGREVSVPHNRKISVAAASIHCRASNVDIVSRRCELKFKGHPNRSLKGREANELFSTLAAAGVDSEGAAGSINESVTRLACRIDPHEIRRNDGSGADCVFK
jgi:hypothetical protein